MKVGREFLRDILTASLLPLAVFVLEMLLNRGQVLNALVLYVTSVVLIFAIVKGLHALSKHLPIRLSAVGRIDGWWIDKVRNLAGSPIGGATIHIQSEGDGFTLNGKIYVLSDENTLQEAGWFVGQGYAAAAGNSVGYSFYGEVRGEADNGSGHFKFIPPDPPGKNTTRATGSFIGLKHIEAHSRDHPAHHFDAEKIDANSQAAAKGLLLAKLLTTKQLAAAAKAV